CLKIQNLYHSIIANLYSFAETILGFPRALFGVFNMGNS
ncbi:hypothetical protein, partial [uncultured Gammaproteobacteria bacterium]